MGNEWILDVLTDLRRFAAANGMERLADRIDETALVAASEIAARGRVSGGEGGAGATGRDGAGIGPHP